MTQITCAFCDSTNVELFSLFGQTLLGSQYYCKNCKSIFEVVRFEEEETKDQVSSEEVCAPEDASDKD